MALGDSNNFNSNNKTFFENAYYSRIKFKNKEGLYLSFSFKSGMLIAAISKKNDNNEYEELISIYITATKAEVLCREIDKINEEIASIDKANNKGYGIMTGLDETVSVMILRSIDTEYGVMPAITIGKVNSSGAFVKRVDFDFNTHYNFGINWENIDSMEVTNDYIENIEWDQFCAIIRDFAAAANGANAYFTLDLARYDYKALMNKLNPIYDKLGIERQTYGSKRTGNNFFTSNERSSSNKSSTNKSYDDLMDSIEQADEDLPFDE